MEKGLGAGDQSVPHGNGNRYKTLIIENEFPNIENEFVEPKKKQEDMR